MTRSTRRNQMDRKIVELLKGGAGVNQVVAALRVSKVRVRRLREQAQYAGFSGIFIRTGMSLELH